ncbi:MAG: hypothetical protein EBV50_02250, partial [Betaproteobacteria bacterium]|nr:hypothetical protein [Betaproteobacteria bacterium]
MTRAREPEAWLSARWVGSAVGATCLLASTDVELSGASEQPLVAHSRNKKRSIRSMGFASI